jgi:ankyrin repeat protein
VPVKVDINCAAHDGTTPLLVACARGNDQCVQVLCAYDECDVNRASADGLTPLIAGKIMMVIS